MFKSQLKHKNLLRKQPVVKVRNYDELNAAGIEKAKLPSHPQFRTTVTNKFEEFIDPYKYLENPSVKQIREFDNIEAIYRKLLTVKHNLLEKVFEREIDNRELKPDATPIHYNDYIYYRNIDNTADLLTLYRYPIDKIEENERKGKVT
jgi:hypothetical protein